MAAKKSASSAVFAPPGPPLISEGMSADDVWLVIADILDSVKLAGGKSVHAEVSDYVSNRFGD